MKQRPGQRPGVNGHQALCTCSQKRTPLAWSSEPLPAVSASGHLLACPEDNAPMLPRHHPPPPSRATCLPSGFLEELAPDETCICRVLRNERLCPHRTEQPCASSPAGPPRHTSARGRYPFPTHLYAEWGLLISLDGASESPYLHQQEHWARPS